MTRLYYFLLLLGLFEVISNLFHLSKKTIEDIAASAKKQHQEIPLILPPVHFYYKVIIMFIFGLLFVAAGFCGILRVPYFPVIIWTVTVCFGLYGLIQALIYRKSVNVWPAMIVYAVPLIITWFFREKF